MRESDKLCEGESTRGPGTVSNSLTLPWLLPSFLVFAVYFLVEAGQRKRVAMERPTAVVSVGLRFLRVGSADYPCHRHAVYHARPIHHSLLHRCLLFRNPVWRPGLSLTHPSVSVPFAIGLCRYCFPSVSHSTVCILRECRCLLSQWFHIGRRGLLHSYRLLGCRRLEFPQRHSAVSSLWICVRFFQVWFVNTHHYVWYYTVTE